MNLKIWLFCRDRACASSASSLKVGDNFFLAEDVSGCKVVFGNNVVEGYTKVEKIQEGKNDEDPIPKGGDDRQ